MIAVEESTTKVDVHWARPDDFSAHDLSWFRSLLDEQELVAMTTLHGGEDQGRYLVSHALLRLILSRQIQTPIAEMVLARRCIACRAAGKTDAELHGKPYLPGSTVQFNLSHAGDRVLIAVSHDGPVGVDVERITGVDFPGFDEVALSGVERLRIAGLPQSEQDRQRAVLWTSKEAVLKAGGWGLSLSPTLLSIDGPEPEVTTPTGKFQVIALDVGTEYSASVAAQSDSPIAAVLRKITPESLRT